MAIVEPGSDSRSWGLSLWVTSLSLGLEWHSEEMGHKGYPISIAAVITLVGQTQLEIPEEMKAAQKL